MNTNAWHNIFNIVSLIVGGISWVLLQLGCTEDPVSHAIACSADLPLDPSWLRVMTAVAFVLPGIKLIMNAVRDGFGGMFKPQPPVER